MKKNRYSLTQKSSRDTYNWWWHSFVATDNETGELKPFFIEYYVVNHNLWNGVIALGQDKENNAKGVRPCYAMMKVGTWGEDKVQLHSFYNMIDYDPSDGNILCRIGPNVLMENSLSGAVCVSEVTSKAFPERMTDAGSMSWLLSVKKDVSYNVGYGSSSLLNKLGAFEMFWHVQGMRCQYEGEITFNDKTYTVITDTSYGYQDRNWGKDYTNPWIWLNCNNFHSEKTDEKVDASLVVGGGCPKVFWVSLERKILTAFYYKGELIEFNFSKFWKKQKQDFRTHEDNKYFYWEVSAENRKYKLEAKFKCEKSKMIFMNYESPNGVKNHDKLWNGGHAQGELKLYKKVKRQFKLVEVLKGELGGCEYGEY